jgi:membrane-bound metal-dependent hydrolase YbcI (DUF457 family)
VPLTPSHAAAALLLRRIDPRLPISALVVGTLAPDFEYILRLAPRGGFAHSLVGVLLFCLPVSLVVWFAYDRIVRPAVTDLLPRPLAAELKNGTPAGLPAVAAALLLGALSHVTWDAFTHRTGFFVQHLAPLRARVLPELTAGPPVYSFLQHGSTAVGAILLCLVTLRWIRGRPASARRYGPGEATRPVSVLVLVGLAAGAGAVLNGSRVLDRGAAPGLGYAAVGAMAASSIALLGYGWYARRRAG